jgi:hypothetical protein
VGREFAEACFPAFEVRQPARAELIDLFVCVAQAPRLAIEQVLPIDGVATDLRKRLQRVEECFHVAFAVETLRPRPPLRMVAPLQQLPPGAANSIDRPGILVVGPEARANAA